MYYVTMLLSAMLFAALATNSVQAEPARKPALECTSGGLTSPPKFTQLSPGRAEYSFGGACISRYGPSFVYRIDATWTPPENGKGNANATEIMHIDMLSGPPQSYSILLGARCNADPWLYSANCERIGDNVPEKVRAWWYDVTSAQFPFSRFGITHDQRIALREAYDRANNVFDPSALYSDRARIETIEKVGAQGGAMEMSKQVVSDAAKPSGAEAGIIIVGGNPPHQQATTGETDMAGLQSGVSERTAKFQNTNGMLSDINQSNHSVVGNIGEGGPDAVSAPKPEPPICANARAARARNSPAAPNLERQCIAAGGSL